MQANEKREFFDTLSEKWDGFEEPAVVVERLTRELAAFEIGADEVIVDLGCGTGNLTQALLATLSPNGRVIAVDSSPKMIETAQKKVNDPRVQWLQIDAHQLPLDNASVDRVICFSAWPHFEQPATVGREIHRVLRKGGVLHIWHLTSRQMVNHIHSSGHPSIAQDVLAEPADINRTLLTFGFGVKVAEESANHFLVTAVK